MILKKAKKTLRASDFSAAQSWEWVKQLIHPWMFCLWKSHWTNSRSESVYLLRKREGKCFACSISAEWQNAEWRLDLSSKRNMTGTFNPCNGLKWETPCLLCYLNAYWLQYGGFNVLEMHKWKYFFLLPKSVFIPLKDAFHVDCFAFRALKSSKKSPQKQHMNRFLIKSEHMVFCLSWKKTSADKRFSESLQV